jgi:hypothetical protein
MDEKTGNHYLKTKNGAMLPLLDNEDDKDDKGI